MVESEKMQKLKEEEREKIRENSRFIEVNGNSYKKAIYSCL